MVDVNNIAVERNKLEVLVKASATDVAEDMEKLSRMTNIKRANLYSHAGRMEITLPASEGISNQLSADESSFIEAKGNIGWELSPFPYRKSKFISIVNSLRRKLKSLCFGNSDLISEENFKEYLKFYEEKIQEWEDEKEYIKAIYDDTISHFKKQMESIVEKSHPSKKTEIMKEVINKTSIPVEVFLSCFDIGISTDFEIESLNWSEEEKNLKEMLGKLKEQAIVNDYNKIVDGLLQEAWRTLVMYIYNTCVISLSTSDVVSQARQKTFREKIAELRDSNILGDVRFDKILNEFFNLSKINSKNELREYALDTFAVLYKIGVDTNNVLPMSISLGKSNNQNGNKVVEFPYEDFTATDLMEHYEDLVEAMNS